MAFFIRIPIIQPLIIQCWPLIMTKCIWVVSKNRKNASCTPPSRSASLTSFLSPPQVFLKERLLCHDVWLQNKTYLPSTEIRNILVRSNSEAPVIDFPKKLLENPMNISATWGAWSLASVVFSCVSWHRVHTYGSKIDTRLLQHKNVQEVTGRTSSPAWNLSKLFAYCSIWRTLSGIVQLKTWAII